MSRKIIGITVGSQLPKPDFAQNDPTKGDYIKNKPDLADLQSKESAIYRQPEAPENAPEGALWIDTDADNSSGGNGSNGSMPDATDAPEGAFLRVIDGKAAWQVILDAEEATF